jgi:ribosomal protein S18 acetylase RimI-like enzyme
MELRIRRAGLDDAPEIARVHVETWRAAYAHVFPADYLAGLSVDERIELWTQTLSGGRYDVFVAELDGRIRGFASAGPTEDDDEDAPPGELYAIYVDAATWGLGLGRALLARAEQALRDSGFDAAALWVLEDNPRAQRLYEAAGWTADGASKPFERGGVVTAVIRYRKRLD